MARKKPEPFMVLYKLDGKLQCRGPFKGYFGALEYMQNDPEVCAADRAVGSLVDSTVVHDAALLLPQHRTAAGLIEYRRASKGGV